MTYSARPVHNFLYGIISVFLSGLLLTVPAELYAEWRNIDNLETGTPGVEPVDVNNCQFRLYFKSNDGRKYFYPVKKIIKYGSASTEFVASIEIVYDVSSLESSLAIDTLKYYNMWGQWQAEAGIRGPYLIRRLSPGNPLENDVRIEYFVGEKSTQQPVTIPVSNHHVGLQTDCPAGIINFNNFNLEKYGTNQNFGLQEEVEDSGSTIRLQGNGWRRIDIQDYEITESTILEFDFWSEAEGEIHSIGFDNDNNLSGTLSFRVHGTQNWGHELEQYFAGIKHYKIRVGSYFAGSMKYLTFGNDHDVSNPSAISHFSNVRIYEAN